MTLAGGTHAQDDADGALGKVGLIRMRDNARIEERRALERILACKVGANEQLAFFGHWPVAWQVALHLLKTLHEDFPNPLVPTPKLAKNLLQNRQNLFLRQRKDSRENLKRARCVVRIDRLWSGHRRQKGTHKHARSIRTQDQWKPANRDGRMTHSAALPLAIVRPGSISANEEDPEICRSFFVKQSTLSPISLRPLISRPEIGMSRSLLAFYPLPSGEAMLA